MRKGVMVMLGVLTALVLAVPSAAAQEPVEATIERFIGFCSGGSQLCVPPFALPVETGGDLFVRYVVPPSHCSSLRIHLYVDGVLQVTTGFLGWEGAGGVFAGLPLETSLMDLGPVPAGAHVLEIQAEGQAGGCNNGQVRNWAGSLEIVATTLDFDEAVQALIRLRDFLAGLQLAAGFGGHLLEPLEAAVDRLSDGNLQNDIAACGALSSFRQQVQNQLRFFLPNDAARLTQQPEVIAASLGCR